MANEEEYQKKEFPVLEPGDYDVTINNKLNVVDCKPPSTNQKIAVELLYIDGEGTKYKVFDNVVLGASSEWKLYQFCKCFGIEISPEGEIDLDTAQGLIGTVALKQEIYNGKPKNRVDAYKFEAPPEEEPSVGEPA
jgi:hypothetical protein